jgi:hypothetical protein
MPPATASGDPFASQRRLPPADGITAVPVFETLPASTLLWRIHHSDAAPDAFPPVVAGLGGRFDTSTPGVTQLYLGDSPHAAIAETILRDAPLVDTGARQLPFSGVSGRSISRLVTECDLVLVSLHGPDAAVIGQGAWLTKSAPDDYPLTRAWADALCAAAPDAAGLVWRCRFDEDRLAYAVYADRVASGSFAVSATVPIDSGGGLVAVRKILLGHNAVIGG